MLKALWEGAVSRMNEKPGDLNDASISITSPRGEKEIVNEGYRIFIAFDLLCCRLILHVCGPGSFPENLVVFNGPEQQENWDYLSPTYTQAIDMGGFAVFSARLTVTPVKYFKCFLGFENLTNLDYAFVNGYPMAGRTVRGGLEMRF
jgi:hypothetical protein